MGALLGLRTLRGRVAYEWSFSVRREVRRRLTRRRELMSWSPNGEAITRRISLGRSRNDIVKAWLVLERMRRKFSRGVEFYITILRLHGVAFLHANHLKLVVFALPR